MSTQAQSVTPAKETTPLKTVLEAKVNYTEIPSTISPKERPLSKLRFLVLILLSVLGAAVVISCEQLLPLQKNIIQDLRITHTEYTLLLVASTLPNIFFPLLGGWVFDSLGRGLCLTLFGTALVIGQFLVAIGGAWQHYNLILFGRLVSALGGENLNVTISGYLYYWYKGLKMGTPMALATVVSLLASTCSYLTTPILYNESHELSYPMWVAFTFCLFGLICGLFAGALTIYGERRGFVGRQEVKGDDVGAICDLKRYKPVFWLVLCSAFFVSGTVFSTLGISSGFIQEKYGFSNVHAGFLLVYFCGVELV